MSFGERFRLARINKQLSQIELATLMGVSYGAISNYEKNIAFPRVDKIKKACEILEVDPNFLFWDDLSDNIKSIVLKQQNNKTHYIELYDKLDSDDKAEIRGEIKHMLKADKYTTNSENNIADDIINELKQIADSPMHDLTPHIKQK